MKQVLLTLTLFASALQANAKITVYNTTDAIKLVLNDQATMQRLLGSSLREAEVRGISVSYSTKGFNKNFTVRVDTSAQTPVGERPCSTDISVLAVTKQVGLPNGGPGISTSQLVISKIGQTNCAP